MSKGKSCLTSLFAFYDQMAGSVHDRRAVDVVYIDFSKMFGIISCSILTGKLVREELSKWTERWMDICLDCRA